jgi:hypothetical protein
VLRQDVSGAAANGGDTSSYCAAASMPWMT